MREEPRAPVTSLPPIPLVLRRAILALALLPWIAASTAKAEPPLPPQPVVVELFTSQGCSSCPPADELLHYLSKRDDVIALALHVDYWDYIGWADSFAQRAFTKRQKYYARAAGQRMIYTPQMVVAGQDLLVGTRPMEVSDAIARHRATPAVLAVRLARVGDEVKISAAPPREAQGMLVVLLVRYRPEATVEITRGENAGRTLRYANIVTELSEVARWDGRGPLDLSVPAPGPSPTAVMIQKAGHGPILAAAALP